MNGQIDFIKSEHAFSDAFLAGKRSELSAMAQPFFERMRSKYRITHFYFHRKDQVCFLRVHSPGRFGDLIERFTMKGVVSTGKPFYGIELGPLGTFTLRTVHPWIVEDRLEGYIELGMEIENITRLIRQALNLELLVLIEKKFLNREGWEAGLKILNRKGNWDLFRDFVIVDRTMEATSVLDKKLLLHNKDDGEIFSVEIGSSHYKGEFNDLVDAGGRRVGEIVSMMDVTAQHKNLQVLVLTIVGISLIVGGGLLLFFSSFIGKIQDQLISSREKLLSEIDAHRQSEEALALSEKRFRSLFDDCKDAIVTTDMDGKPTNAQSVRD